MWGVSTRSFELQGGSQWAPDTSTSWWCIHPTLPGKTWEVALLSAASALSLKERVGGHAPESSHLTSASLFAIVLWDWWRQILLITWYKCWGPIHWVAAWKVEVLAICVVQTHEKLRVGGSLPIVRHWSGWDLQPAWVSAFSTCFHVFLSYLGGRSHSSLVSGFLFEGIALCVAG